MPLSGIQSVILSSGGANMSYNLASKEKSERERERVSVDLAAAGVAYKERLNMPVIPHEVELQQPAALREYFRERVVHYRQQSQLLPKGTDAVYQKEAKE